jgi:hypothetical protein
MEDSKNLFLCSKFSWERYSISSKYIENLALCPPQGSPALSYTDWFVSKQGMQQVHAWASPGLASN